MLKNLKLKSGHKGFRRTKLLLSLLIAFQISVFGQGKQITGTVSSESGETLPGVNVIVKDKSIGTVTNFDGQYTIRVTGENDELMFSFVGYDEKIVPVGSKSEINVTLIENVQEMDEVIVVGYGTQKKSDVTGSVASISAESLSKQPATRVDEALQGKAAGVMVLQNSGSPGSDPVIQIRGMATINGGSPLVIIDGNAGGSLSSINPNDIQSIEILKDAASQGIYGSAGGNGVILVTTKKGQSGKISATLNMYTGIQTPWSTDQVQLADANQFAEIYNKYKTSNGNAAYFAYDEASGSYLNPETNEPLQSIDWVDEIFRVGVVQNYNLSVNGGNKNSTFYFSAGYSSEEGTVHKTSNDRMIVRLNSEHKLGDKIRVGQNFNVAQNVYQGQGEHTEYGSPLSGAVQMYPFVPVYAKDGSGNFEYREAGLSCNIKNPMAQIEYNNNISRSTSMFGNIFARAEIISGLTFESRVSGNYNPTSYIGYTPAHDIGSVGNESSSLSVPENKINYNVTSGYGWQWQNFITYSKTFAEKHNLNVVLGTESGYNYYEFTNREENGFELDESKWESFSDTTVSLRQHKEIETSGYAYFARLTYDYDGIYLLQANFRRDYSSKFGPNNRVGNFPSISLGLKFSEYNFIKNIGIVDFGKLRIGYGETGNSDIQPFLYLNSFGPVIMNAYPFGGEIRSGASLLTAANPDLKWETVVTKNIGLDLRFLKNRLSISADAFSRQNKDMLLRKSVPYSVGYYISDAGQELGDAALDTRPLVNYGTLDNKGFEFSIDFKDKIGDLSYSINANLTRAITVIDDIGDPLYAGTGRGLSQVCRTQNGEAVSTFYGYKTDGVYSEEDLVWYSTTGGKKWLRAPIVEGGKTEIDGIGADGNPLTFTTNTTSSKVGNYRFVDTDGDGTISVLDMTAIGDPNPDFTYGFGGSLEWKGFDVNLFFQGSYGNDIYNMLKVNLYTMNNGGLNVSPDLINSYIPALYDNSKPPVMIAEAENTTTGMFRMDGDLASSDFYVEDGSYLRMKNIQIGYTLPISVTQKVKISHARIYVGAKNLLTFTNYTGFDPEVGATTILERGFDKGTYPQSKLFTLGVNVSF